MPPKSSKSKASKSEPAASQAQSRYGRAIKVTTRARDGSITDEVHKFATHDAKGKQRKVAEMIQLQPEGEPDDHLLSGQFEPWREPTPTGDLFVDQQVRDERRAEFLLPRLLFSHGINFQQQLNEGFITVNELQALWDSGQNQLKLKDQGEEPVEVKREPGTNNVQITIHDKVHLLPLAKKGMSAVPTTNRQCPFPSESTPSSPAIDKCPKIASTATAPLKPKHTPLPLRPFHFIPSASKKVRKPDPTAAKPPTTGPSSKAPGAAKLPPTAHICKVQ